MDGIIFTRDRGNGRGFEYSSKEPSHSAVLWAEPINGVWITYGQTRNKSMNPRRDEKWTGDQGVSPWFFRHEKLGFPGGELSARYRHALT